MDRQIERAACTSRTNTLTPRTEPRNPTQRVPFVMTYHPGLRNTTKILKRHLPILHISERLRGAIPNPPLVAFRRPKNLRDMLVRAELSEAAPPTQPGNIPCNNRRCKTRNILIQSDSFTSPCTGSTHKIRFEFKCTTRNLVYLIQCRRCGLQYVGETGNPLHTRMNSHRSDIRTTKIEKPVAAHFTQPDHSLEDLQVMGIEKIYCEDATLRKLHESYWISTLGTMAPTGMNIDD